MRALGRWRRLRGRCDLCVEGIGDVEVWESLNRRGRERVVRKERTETRETVNAA